MNPIVVKFEYKAKLDKVWSAFSNESELKQWFFPVQNFIFEPDAEFTFYESDQSCKFLHKCKYISIIDKKLIEHTWEHPSHSKGVSVVRWEFEENEANTVVTFTHSGVENFADAGPDFSRQNFEMGWNALVKTNLKNYLYGIKKLVFNIEIEAKPEKVWYFLFDPENYKNWTNVFCEGSYYEGILNQGERIHFLTPSGEGMYSDVYYIKENSVMCFMHLGELKDFKEVPISDDVESWSGCFELYRLEEIDSKTKLSVEVDVIDKYVDHMNNSFVKALDQLKINVDKSKE